MVEPFRTSCGATNSPTLYVKSLTSKQQVEVTGLNGLLKPGVVDANFLVSKQVG